MSRSAPIFAAGLVCLGLAGCALGGSVAPTTYDLIAPRSFAAAAKPARYQLVVNEVPVMELNDLLDIFQDEGTISAILWRDY